MSEAAEEFEALFDLVMGERDETLGAEALDSERTHDTSVKHGALEDDGSEFGLRCDVPHEASGESVTGTGRVLYLGDGEGRGAEWVRTVGEKDGGTVLAMLDDQRFGAEGKNLSGGKDQAVLAGEELGFAIIDEKDIDFLQCFEQFGALDVNPEIHGVAADESYSGHFAAHVELQFGLDVGEEENLGVCVSGRNLGGEVFKNIEVGEISLGLVYVFAVLAAPMKCFAGSVLDATGINAATGEDGFVLGSEIFSDDANDPDLGKEAGGEREVGGSTAENLFALTERGFQSIECDRTDDENGHVMRLPLH
jgi:hypothetical protein